MVVLLFALGAFVTGAAAAKPKLWLIHGPANTHAAPGEAARIRVSAEGCVGEQAASVASNGRPVDRIAGSGALAAQCNPGFKQAGSIKSVAVAPSPEGVAMTVTGLVHVGIEPWCTYTLPHNFTLPEAFSTDAHGVVSGTLQKAASFGACAPTLEVHIFVVVEQLAEEIPYRGEVIA
jgi:hypothetical protein